MIFFDRQVKRFALISALATASLLMMMLAGSCSKQGMAGGSSAYGGNGALSTTDEGCGEGDTLCISFCRLKSKAVSEGLEENISSLDVIVLRDDSEDIVSYGHSAGVYVDARVPKKVEVEYWIIANAPADIFSDLNTRSQFTSMVSLLTHNTASTLVMVGHGRQTFEKSESVEVEVTPAVSKLTLGGFTPSFYGTVYPGAAVSLRRAFLINVCGSIPYTLVPTAGSEWLSKLSLDSSLSTDMKTFLVSEKDINITSKDRIELPGTTFYFYPNPVSNDVTSATEPLWSPRSTRLVLELQIGSFTQYYALSLPAMQSGKAYSVDNLNLRGPGSESPDILTDRTIMSFQVSVKPFDPSDIDCDLKIIAEQ